MKTVFLYAGQGSQHVGMGKDFYEEYESYRDFVDSVSSEKNLKALMHEDLWKNCPKQKTHRPVWLPLLQESLCF